MPFEPPLSPKDRVGFAVVALGRLSVEQILPAFAQTKKCKLAALVSGTPDKVKMLGDRYDVPESSLYSFDCFDAIAQNEEVGVVYIVLPIRCIASLWCERPLPANIFSAKSRWPHLLKMRAV